MKSFCNSFRKIFNAHVPSYPVVVIIDEVTFLSVFVSFVHTFATKCIRSRRTLVLTILNGFVIFLLFFFPRIENIL